MKSALYKLIIPFFFLFGMISITAQTGSSISLDGTNTSYATLSNNSALEFSTGTIEFWVYPENYSGAGAIIAMRDVNGTRFSIHLDVQNSTIGLWDGANYRTLPSILIAQNWVHLAFVFKAATTDVYRNGVFLGTLSNTVNTAITGKILTLGQNGQAGEYFTGKIDELRIWNDERTVDEISTYEFQELGGFEENLVAYYNFDEGSGTTAANKVGNAVASVGFQSGAAWGSNSAGVDPVLAKAVYFNVDRFMTVPNNAALETNDQTIEFWVKPFYVSSSYSPSILAMRDVNGTRFSIHMANDRGSVGVWNGTNYFSVNYSFTNETWYHIAVVMNSNTSSTEFFVNGASVGTQNFTHSNVTGKDLTIAQNGEGGEQFFGEIDELRIWNDLRTAQEISDNYQKELNGQQSNLAAYFRFNEGSGVSTRNWVQNGVGNGTFQNSSYWTDHDFIVTVTETTASQPSGSGLQSDPYLISNLAELRWVSENSSSWSSYFEQTADIDASETSSWNSNAGFSPIGNNLANFTGNYDGKGKTINGITIVAGLTSSDSYKGFFGSLLNATVKNLKLTNINITGGYLNVGGLVGHLSFSQILNCGVEGDINNAFSSTGLVFGSAGNNSVILECYAKGNVTAKIYGGIFCGVVQTSSSITNSYAVGTVKRVDATFIYFGLFAGRANSSTISKCFTKGNIFDSNGTTVFRTDAGFIGSFSSNIITDCFFDSLASNQKSDVFVVAKTTSEMKTAATFSNANWDITGSVWKIDATETINNGYPFLAWEDSSGTALPVELTSFTANINENQITLNWKTATEVNNYGFEVERSKSSNAKSEKWESIGFVKGSGNSNSPKEYVFVDKSSKQGKYLYRLKQIDFDGKFEYSNTVEVDANTLPTKFNLSQNFPNPFNPTTTIKYSIPAVETANSQSMQTNVTIKIYDILGNEVATLVNEQKSAGSYEVVWNASNIVSGVYLYRISAGKFNQFKKMMLLK